MKALILAGGYATRLRPISCRTPKLLFPILGRPLLERTFDNLSSIGIDEVILAVNYLSDVLKAHFGKTYNGIRINYSLEDCPLGTAGPIKKAKKMLEKEAFFFTLNGDILFDDKIKEILKVHEKKSSAIVALHEVDDPSRFGVVVLGKDNYITRFVEKPSAGEVNSCLINAGMYLLSSDIFNYIPGGRVSMETDVFPRLAKENKLLGFRYTGEWYDIGKIDDYIAANYHYLTDRAKNNPIIQKGSEISVNVDLINQSLICRRSIVKSGSKIGPYAIIGEDSVIGENVNIEDAILFKSTKVGNNSHLRKCIIGNQVHIGNNVHIEGGAVIGDAVKIGDGIKIIGKVKICPNEEVKKDIIDDTIFR